MTQTTTTPATSATETTERHSRPPLRTPRGTRREERSAFGQWLREFFAGAVAGAGQVASGMPFDTWKVRVQSAPPGSSAISVLRELVRAGGVRGLYAGSLSPLLGNSVCASIQFSAFELTKRAFQQRGAAGVNGAAAHANVDAASTASTPSNARALSVAELFASGAVGGLAQAPLTSAIELVRITMQVQRDGRYSGSVDCARSLVREHGVWRGLLRGLSATTTREALGFGCYFATYDLVVSRFRARRAAAGAGGVAPAGAAGAAPGVDAPTPLSPYETLAAGALSGLGFWIPVFPVDVIKTRLQVDSVTAPRYRGAIDCVRQTWRTSGVGGFYRGFAPCLLRALPVNATTFLAFETAMSVMGGR